jgi:UDP-N-acetylglucosamine acyltransferase
MNLYNNDWINIDGNEIHKTAIIHPNVSMGKGNTIGAFCVIGGNGEIRGISQKDFKGQVVIGNNNVISEFVSIQRPAECLQSTFIGDNNLIMAHSHIGHDVFISNNTEICSGSVIGGHVKIGNGSKIKLKCVIRNRVLVGENAIVGMGSVVTKNIENNQIVYGNPAKPRTT